MAMSRSHTGTRPGRGERGAILVQVAIAFLGLTAMSAFVVDYGVLWSARRQAQNAADSGAMAAAVSLGFVDAGNQSLARTAALNAAAENRIWGAPPDITGADVTFPACPVGARSAGSNHCVKVDVFRNERPGGNPLPTFFGRLAGVMSQGVQATATAEVIWGLGTNCNLPFAIPDKWIETYNNQGPLGWDTSDSFERYVPNGNNAGQVLSPNPDTYVPPSGGSTGVNGSGFDTRPGFDRGLQITIKSGNPNQAIQPGWYYPVVLNPSEGPGGSNYRDNISGCDPTVVDENTILTMEPGNMIGPTQQGISALIAQDPNASWGTTSNGTPGIVGGCMASTTNPCAISPRLRPLPVFDPDVWDRGPSQGRSTVDITRVIGLFVEGMQGNDVIGRIVPYPSAPYGTGGVPGAAAIVTPILVR